MRYAGLLVELAKTRTVKTYVELGVRDGDTFNMVSPYVDRAIGVDTKPMNGVIKHPHVRLLQMTTDEAVSYVNSTTIDLLFIDACHAYKQAHRDFINYINLVKPETGLVIMHDTCPVKQKHLSPRYCHDVWRVADTIRRDPQYEIVSLPGPIGGLSIIRKSNGQLCIDHQ